MKMRFFLARFQQDQIVTNSDDQKQQYQQIA